MGKWTENGEQMKQMAGTFLQVNGVMISTMLLIAGSMGLVVWHTRGWLDDWHQGDFIKQVSKLDDDRAQVLGAVRQGCFKDGNEWLCGLAMDKIQGRLVPAEQTKAPMVSHVVVPTIAEGGQ